MGWTGRPRINTGYVSPETPAACGHLLRPADRRRRRVVRIGESLEERRGGAGRHLGGCKPASHFDEEPTKTSAPGDSDK
jgi:hypothetical protein